MRKGIVCKRLVLLSFSVVLVSVLAGTGVASANTVYPQTAPTFVGPAATGCASGCSLLAGPTVTASTASTSSSSRAAATLKAGTALSGPRAMPAPTTGGLAAGSAPFGRARTAAAAAPTPVIPTVRCQPLGAGCDSIDTSAGGATGVKGLNAVDSASLATNPLGDIEPPDQGLCAGNGSVVETNNIGEILVYNTALQRQSAPIPLDTVMGLTAKGWSSGGDPSCEFDSSNGGHWFFTEIASASPESAGGPFTGCFVSGPKAVANACYEAIAVSQTSSPFGPYWVYYLNANYDPSEPGFPFLLNDFAKIGVTRDAFMLFYDEFPLGPKPGMGGGAFNGAQQFAFDKNALERGRPVTVNGQPNPNFIVARQNMGLLPTPDGNCDGTGGAVAPGVDCWVAVIPAQPADAGQYDNHNGGSGFMIGGLDFNSFATLPSGGDNRMATWAWTGLGSLSTGGGNVKFGGELFTGTNPYYNPENAVGDGILAAQKVGPIPLGNRCGAAGLSVSVNGNPPPKSCPENGLNTNGDFMTQASQAQGQVWAAMSTQVRQRFGTSSELHMGAVYWVVDTGSFDRTGQFTITNQGFASAAHEDLNMPAIATEGTGGNGKAIMLFTLSGNGGPTAGRRAGFFPSTAYGRMTATSLGLTSSTINVADAGQSPQDGFSEYQFYPGLTRPRWGDYSWGIYLPDGSNRLYFANEYIQSPNCTGRAFTLTIGTCGGTRDGFANWGTSVNSVVP